MVTVVANSNPSDRDILQMKEEIMELGEDLATFTSGSHNAPKVMMLQQRLKDMAGKGSEWGFVLNDHSFAELKDWVASKTIPSCRAHWNLFSIMVTMGPVYLMGND
jgi:hypothetical protein